jgi:hypothetical protein
MPSLKFESAACLRNILLLEALSYTKDIWNFVFPPTNHIVSTAAMEPYCSSKEVCLSDADSFNCHHVALPGI